MLREVLRLNESLFRVLSRRNNESLQATFADTRPQLGENGEYDAA